jgi:hypothetical protein
MFLFTFQNREGARMEGLVKRTWVLAGIVVACGAYTMYVPPPRSKPIDEHWMAQHAPDSVGDYVFVPKEGLDGASDRMSDITYSTLQPSGILDRHYVSGSKQFDVVLIASDNSVSFHDPRVCFTAQGWNISHESRETVHTATGDIPVTYVKMRSDGGDLNSAMYFYRSPSGFESVARKMRWDMLLGELLHGRNDQGVFYRFIPLTNNITDQDLVQFAGQYLDAAHKTSGGFF